MTALPFKVKALYEYSSAHDDDLKFGVGQIITVTDEEDDDWYSGEYVDGSGITQQGIFPRNFVEKYEPVAPPRPTRTRSKPDPTSAPVPAPAPAPVAVAPEVEPEPEPEPSPELEPETAIEEPAPPPQPAPVVKAPIAVAQPPSLPTPAPADQQAPPVPKPAEVPAPALPVATKPAPSKPSGPPPVATKPTSNAFKDRIAAFNKASAPPIAPFKPSSLGSGSSGFIKKPFVAPPPSRNAYVPPPRETPTAKIYRRDEDPEIKEREAENQENAERAGLAPTGSHDGDEAEDQPKPTSLKERIALLQKQHMEQAQRHAEAAARKEKPKRPPKKRTESHEGSAETEPVVPTMDKQDAEDTTGRISTDEPHPQRMQPPRRKSSKGAAAEPIQDGNEADMSGAGDTTEGPDELTEREEGDEKQKRPPSRQPTQEAPREAEENEGADEEEGEEGEDVDPEVRRKEELRARMAKMSGGMGMAGMFGIPMPGMSVTKKKVQPVAETHEEPREISPAPRALPVPGMMGLPGMSQSKPEPEVRSPPSQVPSTSIPVEEEPDYEETESPSASYEIAAPELPAQKPTSPPPIPGGRPAPSPVPGDSRPPPLPPVLSSVPAPMSQLSEGSESDDEMSEMNQQPPVRDAGPAVRAPPPPPVSVPAPPVPTSPRSPDSKRLSYVGDESSPGSASQPHRRASRPPPPIPGSAPLPVPGQSRPPPPPPPAGALSRSSTGDTGMISPKHPAPPAEEEEVTEYEGDYDTDIASSVPHKDALKAHARQHSSDETPVRSPVSDAPPNLPPPPPVPASAAPRAVPPAAPPPLPSQPPPPARTSVDMPRGPPPPRPSADMPRAAPPPPPPPKEAAPRYDEGDYDPYNYSSPSQGVPIPGMAQSPTPRSEEPSYYPEPSLAAYSPPDRRGPPPSSGRASHRQSLDIHRGVGAGKRSLDAPRPSISMEAGFVANDIDLAQYSNWWIQPNKLPPSLDGKKDIYYEFEESISTSNGQQIVTKDLYVLYNDYSQTVITASYDTKNMLDVELDQRHEPPPRTLRQDELEQAWLSLGKSLADAARERKDTVVGDGTPASLVYELLKPLKSALPPVGTRSYGALVYQNIGNASTQLNDEIRPGDIITIRNAKFSGKHGPMHAKYSVEIGKGDQVHTGIVAEWDGTKKKVRAWEQGRESKKCKVESFKLDDLRSGEVKIWRLMSRAWVGWADRA